MRFKKSRYPVGSILEWSEFQPWRSPYGLVAYACCSSQADMLQAVRNFEAEKEKLKKSLIASKLFIDMHIKHEMSEEYRSSLTSKAANSRKILRNLNNNQLFSIKFSSTIILDVENLSANSLSMRTSGIDTASFDTASVYSTETLTSITTSIDPLTGGLVSLELDNKLDSLTSDNNSDLDPLSATTSTTTATSLPPERGGPRKILLSHNSANDVPSASLSLPNPNESWSANMSKADETELNTKLKHLDKDVVYLDFLFAQTGVDKIAVIVENEKTKVEQALKEMANSIFKKLLSQIKGKNWI